ncbi:salicylate hydroxylase [Cordyceps fumosorosea ARSEF 2679]|uniref:Salicylate hydroxylase n=1 Tax=Cordyceps fumosorosea (strain ARSEF 2679) TaxID=1081104 RepID=A0A167LZ56_CORFA|nr:salicylate hydroxylase [Cordyceps fumosorosea ARSEF 2679]OAA53713.1 salicylate hydroxylase [Cordyceps fumosorosea ARSEF 2679]
MHKPSSPRIAIVGGGPAGLTLGALLHQRRIPFTVFELRPEPSAAAWAAPSGMLDLHEGDGLRAIRACGLYDEFLPLTGECSEEYVLADKFGERVVLKSDDDDAKRPEQARPEISRNNLAKLLLTRIPPESVRWDSRLHAAEHNDGVTTLDFGGGRPREEFDLVVGADGAWSRVRTLLTRVRPRYSNTQVVTATIRDLSTRHPHLARLVGTGSFSALGDRHAVVSQRGPRDSARVHLWLTTTDEKLGVTTGLASKPPTAAAPLLLGSDRFLGGFGEAVKELARTALRAEEEEGGAEGLDVRGLYALPHGTSWKHRRGLTVVGDAAHVMLPNGEGVNQAMLDATLLAEAVAAAWEEAAGDVCRFGEVLSPRVREFEADMVQRAVKVGEMTDRLVGVMLGEDALNGMLKLFAEFQEEQEQEEKQKQMRR